MYESTDGGGYGEQVEGQGQWPCSFGDGVVGYAAGGCCDGEGRQVMTGLLHEKEFSRKGFLKGGGALIVGFSLGAFAAKAQAGDFVSIPGDSPFAGNAIDQNQVDAW